MRFMQRLIFILVAVVSPLLNYFIAFLIVVILIDGCIFTVYIDAIVTLYVLTQIY